MGGERLKGHLDLLLLAALQDGPRHGYAIIASLRDGSEGALDLPEGTVYPALHRLEHSALVTSSWAAVDGRRRRVYALTRDGRAALARERSEWRRFATAMHAIVGTAS